MQHGFFRQFEPIAVLGASQLSAIHQGALQVLETAGANVRHERMLDLMREHGCHVDHEGQIARIPAGLVEQSLASAPSSYVIKARDAAKDVRIGGDRVYFMQGMGMRFVDPDTWELRPATLREHGDAQVVGDALTNIHVMDGVFAFTDLVGVPPVMQQLEGLASGLRSSSKPQHYGYMKDTHRYAIRMLTAAGATADVEIDVAPPVSFGFDAVEALWAYAELGWPTTACPGPASGATAPASVAGTVTEAWAATMAFIVLTQLVSSGAPVSLQYAGEVVHPQWAHPLDAAPETWLQGAMTTQLCRHFGIPVATPVGFCGQAKMFDYQASMEKSLGVFSAVLSGSHLHVLHGSHGEELGFSNILQVLDDDIAGGIGRFVSGAPMDDDALAIDLILQKGVSPTSFLNHEHTRRHWAAGRFVPVVADWESHVEWTRSGKIDRITAAREKVESILASHTPAALDPQAATEIDDILGEAREHYRESGLISDSEWEQYMAVLDAGPSSAAS